MSESSSHFVAVCPNCLVSLKVQTTFSGRHVRCKHCEHKFRALAPDFPPTPSSSSQEYSVGPHAPSDADLERLTVACPSCDSELSVRKAYAGQFVRCKKCTEKFLVPNIIQPQATSDAARPALDDLFDQLYRDFGDLDSDEPDPSEGPGDVSSEPLLTPDEASDRDGSGSSAEALHPAVSSNGPASEELTRLRSEHALLQEQHAKQEDEIRRLASEFATKVQELQEAGRAESEPLRQRIAELESTLAARDQLAESLGARDSELGDARQRLEALGRQVQELEQARAQLEADRESLGRELQELKDQLGRALSERDGFREQAENRDQALAGSEARIQGLTEQLRRHDEERLALSAERERLEGELHASAAKLEQAGHEQTGREQELRGEAEHHRGEAEQLRGRLAEVEDARAEESRRSAEQLNRLEDQCRSALADNASLQARINHDLDSWERERAEHRQAADTREAELRAGLQTALEEERSRHAEQLARTEDRCREMAELVERLKGEIMALAHARSGPDTDLEAARMEIEDLRSKLAETETTKKSMSSLLEGMGIRLH